MKIAENFEVSIKLLKSKYVRVVTAIKHTVVNSEISSRTGTEVWNSGTLEATIKLRRLQ